ncbi:hypothetical protein L208DRAFT_1382964 [Tricholoma matsutake]|nr:hypothetical protein L208DRAFT_1382964 [Tricholoma matsutake 945]
MDSPALKDPLVQLALKTLEDKKIAEQQCKELGMQVHQEQEKIVSLKCKHQEEIESQNIKIAPMNWKVGSKTLLSRAKEVTLASEAEKHLELLPGMATSATTASVETLHSRGALYPHEL